MLTVGRVLGVVSNPTHALNPKISTKPSRKNWYRWRQKEWFIEIDGAKPSVVRQDRERQPPFYAESY